MSYNPENVDDYGKKELAQLVHDRCVSLEQVFSDGLFLPHRRLLKEELNRMDADDASWNDSVSQNTIESYSNYLKQFGRVTESSKDYEDDWKSETYTGRYIEEAKAKIDYLTQHPDEQGYRSDEANEESDDTAETLQSDAVTDLDEGFKVDETGTSVSEDSSEESEDADDGISEEVGKSDGDVTADNPHENDSNASGPANPQTIPTPKSSIKKWSFIGIAVVLLTTLGIWGYCNKKQADEEERQHLNSEEMAAHTSEGLSLLAEAERFYNLKDFRSAKAKIEEYIALRKQYDYLPDTIVPWLGRCDTIIKAQQEGTAITPELAKAIENAKKITYFSSGLAIVTYNGGGFSVIDSKGKALDIKAKLGYPPPGFSDGYSYVGINYGGFIDTNGRLLTIQNIDDYSDAFAFSEGLAAVMSKSSGKIGYINTSGKEVIKPQFDYACQFHEGLALVRIGELYFYINKFGNKQFEPFKIKLSSWEIEHPKGMASERGFSDYSDGVALIEYDSGVSLWVDKNGNPLPYGEYVGGRRFQEGLIEYSDNGKQGFKDKNGHVVIDATYESICSEFDGGYAVVKNNSRYGVIDKQENIIIPFTSVEPLFHIGENLFGIRDAKSKKYGVISIVGDTIFKPAFDEIVRSHKNGFYRVRIDDKWGYADKYGISTFDYQPQTESTIPQKSSRPKSKAHPNDN